MNPVTLREMRERFRTLRTPIVMSLFVTVFGGIVWLSYTGSRQATSYIFGRAVAPSVVTASAGRLIFQILLLSILTAVVFVVPAQAAPSIVGEKERQTFKLLQVSQMSALQIVLGKVTAAIAYLALLVITTLPLFAIPFVMGGATVADVVRGMVVIAVTGFTVAAFSVWRSSRARSTQSAVVGSYLLVAVLVIGSAVAIGVEGTVVDGPESVTVYTGIVPQDDGRELISVWFNPYLALVDSTTNVLEYQQNPLGDGAYGMFKRILLKRQGVAFNSYRGGFEGEVFFDRGGFDGGVFIGDEFGPGFNNADSSIVRKRGDVWLGYVVLMLGIAGLALWATVRMVRVPARSERTIGKRRKGRAHAPS
ncbi:ABC-2 family transporter protein [bacterium BMS3Bbin02]|nr:ABC-2 family transporter protein [bacterium BMS3Bbin02]